MISVWKFEFKIDDNIEIEMPYYAEILHVDIQIQSRRADIAVAAAALDGAVTTVELPCIWARVDTERPMVKRKFLLTGTGHTLPDIHLDHVGTFKMQQHSLVFHLFEKL